MEVYVARMLATGQAQSFAGHVTLFQVILAWFVRNATRSMDLFASARFVMIEVFWLNLVLLALATGEKLLSRRGLIALLAAATLAPLWDYGFEVRHDNLLLTGLLLIWCVVRVQPNGVQSYFVAGAISVALEFVAFKAFVYTVPIAAALLAVPPPAYKVRRWKLLVAWLAGAASVFLVVRTGFGLAGLWRLYTAGSESLSNVSLAGHHFWPRTIFERMLEQTPLLTAMTAAALAAVVRDLRRRGTSTLNWSGYVPEAGLFLSAFGALMINPAPFPYNIVLLAPFAFLLAFRYGVTLAGEFQARPTLIPIVTAVVRFSHFVPFVIATHRHLDWPNSRQEALMSRAEAMTDPSRDPVYDGTGMVPTRRINPQMFLHSFHIQRFLDVKGPHLRDLLAANPPAVIMPNYRTDWLPEDDRAYVRANYVELADDFWILGSVMPAGGGDFKIIHPGRYRFSTLSASDLAGTYPNGFKGLLSPAEAGRIAGSLDSVSLSNQIVELPAGTHRLQCDSNCQPAVVWVGPHLERSGRLTQQDHRQLFVNWY